MRRILMLWVAVACLGVAGTASAQSGQGGYLGLNPGKTQTAGTTGLPEARSSGQGGYLGRNVGADVKPLAPAAVVDANSDPVAWCVNSLVPGRCRNRATIDHAWCASNRPDKYASCRRSMDLMGWPP